ncbi:MAG: hypothetical protein N4A32_03745 [Marinifilaceae bacterium]|jgi:hypothetical protein|nr:hypothetical protein [Marinifilaceae bacterium]
MEGNIDGNQEYVYVGKKRRFDPKAIKDKLNFKKRRRRRDPFNSDHRFENSEDRFSNSQDRFKTDEDRYSSESDYEANEENAEQDGTDNTGEDVTKINRETVLVLCPKCHEKYILPAHTVVTFNCNNCNAKIEYDERTYGKEIVEEVEPPKKPWYDFILKIFRYSTYEAKIDLLCTTKISAIPIVLMGILLIIPLFIIFSKILPEFGMGFYLDSIIILGVLIFAIRKLLLALKKMLVLFFPVFIVIVVLLSIYTDYGIKYIFTGYTNLIKLEYGKIHKETKGEKIEKNKAYKINKRKK